MTRRPSSRLIPCGHFSPTIWQTRFKHVESFRVLSSIHISTPTRRSLNPKFYHELNIHLLKFLYCFVFFPFISILKRLVGIVIDRIKLQSYVHKNAISNDLVCCATIKQPLFCITFVFYYCPSMNLI